LDFTGIRPLLQHSYHAFRWDSDRHSAAFPRYLSYPYNRSREHGVENGKDKQDLSNYLMQMHVRRIFDLDYMTLSIEGQGKCAVDERMRKDTKSRTKERGLDLEKDMD